MTLAKLRGVIFDLGATLIENDWDYNQVLTQSLAVITDFLIDQSLPLNRDTFIHDFGQALRASHQQRDDDNIEQTTFSILCNVLQGYVDPLPEERLLRDGLTSMYAVSEVNWKPKPGMRTVLERLTQTGYKLGLLSNAGDEANVQRLIDNVGIRTYFDPIRISAALGIRKPDPRPFLQIAEYWDLSPGEIVMVGDLLEADILGAQRAGMHTIWLSEAAPPEEGIQPDFTAVNLGEVPDLIDRLGEGG